MLYGTTSRGGVYGRGSIYKIRTDGRGYAVLHSFSGADGGNPYRARLFVNAFGMVFGTTPWGGTYDKGVVFKMTTAGTGFTVLHHFAGLDGRFPTGILQHAGALYGVAGEGGLFGRGVLFALNNDGSRFRVLHAFDGDTGVYPSSLAIGSDRALYGTTSGGGARHGGVVYRFVPDDEIQWSAAAYTGGEASGKVTLTVTRRQALPRSVTVRFATIDETARAGTNDYQAKMGTIVFGPGQTTKTVVVAIANDARVEGPETFKVVLSNPSAGAVVGARSLAVVRINDNDGPAIFLSANQYTVAETAGRMTFTIGRWGSSAKPATVRVSTGNGTATAGSDYTALVNRLVTFPVGVVAVNVSVEILNHAAAVEGDEIFSLGLSTPTGAVLGTQKAALVTIVE
jgi:uncharacterized repeat protein (TIGR03803 family)